MDLDLERWRRLRAAAADAKHDGPSFLEVQEANDRRARARDQLERFKAAGARGNPSGPPMAHAHAGETILPGVGGHSHDDVARAHAGSVAELEARVATPSGRQSGWPIGSPVFRAAQHAEPVDRGHQELGCRARRSGCPVMSPGYRRRSWSCTERRVAHMTSSGGQHEPRH